MWRSALVYVALALAVLLGYVLSRPAPQRPWPRTAEECGRDVAAKLIGDLAWLEGQIAEYRARDRAGDKASAVTENRAQYERQADALRDEIRAAPGKKCGL